MSIVVEITEPDKIIEHGLGTEDLLMQAWQNGYPILTSVGIVDENTVRALFMTARERVPVKLIIVPVETEEKSSGKTADKPKRRRRTKAS